MESDDEIREELDPRIKQELEKLNALAGEINRHEIILENARSDFDKCLKDGTKRLTELAQVLGSCVGKSRPYYEAAERANAIQFEFEKASLEYETASTIHEAAREMIAVAEENLLNTANSSFDGAWQDMVNYANNKVMVTNTEVKDCEDRYKFLLEAQRESEEILDQLSYELYKPLTKSRAYYDEKYRMDAELKHIKHSCIEIQEALRGLKLSYTKILRGLEEISESIHRRRQTQMKKDGSSSLTPDQDHQFKELQNALISAKSRNFELQESPENASSIHNESVNSTTCTALTDSNIDSPSTPVTSSMNVSACGSSILEEQSDGNNDNIVQ